VSPGYAPEASRLIDARLAELRRLTVESAAALPETDGVDTVISGEKASITTFRYLNPFRLEGSVLLVVLVARPRWFGIAAHHIERGLMFSPDGKVRDATERELQNSGG
jgi:hypothetical protein